MIKICNKIYFLKIVLFDVKFIADSESVFIFATSTIFYEILAF